VPRYTKMPVDQAAQDVQHSADGYAYGEWTEVATLLAGYFTGAPQAGVSCWYTPAAQPDLAGALKQLTETFGPQGKDGVLVGITTDRSGQKKKDGRVAVVHAQRAQGWWRTPSSTGSARYGMPVMCGMREMAAWAGSGPAGPRARCRAAVLSRPRSRP